MVVLKAALRAAGPGSQARLWLRVDRADGSMGLFDNMRDRPVTSVEWEQVEIRGIVDSDAQTLTLGCMLNGRGTAWFDDLRLEIGEEEEAFAPQPPAPLSERGLVNLEAFARLFGYVRHFHPSDEAQDADWDRVAILGARAVEPARDPAELADILRRLFAPIAPTLRVHARDEESELPPALRPPGDEGRHDLRWWTHHGFGQVARNPVYRSRRQRKRLRDEWPEGAPRPEEPYVAELPGGLVCLVPLALYADEEGTLPRADAGATELGSEFALPAAFRASGDDRGTRLGGVVLAWNVFQHFYPYFDVVETDWPAELRRALGRAAEDEGELEYLQTLRTLVAALHDGHGSVDHVSEPRAGVLPLDWTWVEGRLVVSGVDVSLRDRPEAPVPGDVVLEIDGRAIDDLVRELGPHICAATAQFRRW